MVINDDQTAMESLLSRYRIESLRNEQISYRHIEIGFTAYKEYWLLYIEKGDLYYEAVSSYIKEKQTISCFYKEIDLDKKLAEEGIYNIEHIFNAYLDHGILVRVDKDGNKIKDDT